MAMDCLVNKLCIVGSGEASPRHQTIHRLVMETSKIQPVALPVAMKREGDIFTDWCLVGNKGSFAPNRDSIGSSHPQPPCFRRTSQTMAIKPTRLARPPSGTASSAESSDRPMAGRPSARGRASRFPECGVDCGDRGGCQGGLTWSRHRS